MKCMITGHRPNRLGGYNEQNPTALRVKKELESVFTSLQADHPDIELISGMAQGADIWWTEIGLANHIPVHAHIPFAGQESRWPQRAKDRYYDLVARCTSKKYISTRPSMRAFHDRNASMVRDCDMAVAVWDGSEDSGTGQTVQLLRDIGKTVIVIHPDGN